MHIAVIFFCLLINELKHTACTCQAHGNHRHLHGCLTNGLRQLTSHAEERNDNAQCHGIYAGQADIRRVQNHQRAAEHGEQYVHQISQIVQNRHEHIAVLVCLFAVMKQLFIELDKVPLALFLMAEHLYNLLTAHNFLDKALLCRQRTLLCHHIFGAGTAELFGNCQHDTDKYQNENGHPHTEVQHHAKHGENRQHRLREHRQALADQHTNRIGIIGVGTHDITVRMRVKIRNWQCFHAMKHVIAKMLERALCDRRHDAVICKCRKHAEHIKYSHREQNMDKQILYRSHARRNTRYNAFINQSL